SGGMGAGGLLGSFLAGAFLRRFQLARGYIIAMTATTAFIALIGLSPVAPLAAVLVASYGLCDVLNEVMGTTVIQQGTPDELLGRVFGAFESIVITALMLGALVTGPLVSAL